MRRALDWLVVDALGRAAAVDQPGLPVAPGAVSAIAEGAAANDDSMFGNVTKCVTSRLIPIHSPTA